MRVYFEKPRTTVGWKGLINDPDMDGSFRINHGLRVARELLMEINAAGLPAGLRVSRHHLTPQYIADFVALGCDRRPHDREPGASRTRVGPVVQGGLQERHRRQHQDRVPMRSRAAQQPHHFLSVTKGRPLRHRVDQGQRGLSHLILRGGRQPNL